MSREDVRTTDRQRHEPERSPSRTASSTDQPAHPLLHLQAMIGNQALLRLLRSYDYDAANAPHAKDDKPEQQTVAAAEQATQGPTPQQVLRSPSQPLDPGARTFMEQRFGHDFGHVRVHTNDGAAASALSVNARAYTYGQHIVFGGGEYRPETTEGARLLAHELVHVLQQGPVTAIPDGPFDYSRPGDPSEREADALSNQALSGESPSTAASSSVARLAREEIPVDIEVEPPATREELRQRGVNLPSVSRGSADPRTDSQYIDRRMSAVGFGITLDGYLIFCDDLPVPIFVPNSYIDFGLTSVAAPDVSIYAQRDAAMRAVPYGPPAPGQAERNTTFYRGAGGAVIAPTVFSPATTPRFIELALRARRELVEQVQQELTYMAISLVAGMALQAIINRIARWGSKTPEAPRVKVPPGTGREFGKQMATEMKAGAFKGNPFREFMKRLNARPQRLPPQEAAEAIKVATIEYSSNTMGTMPPVQQGDVLVVPSVAPIPNAPVMGIKSDGTVMMGRAPKIELVKTPDGKPVFPPQSRIVGQITWE